jgi:hypothetical protein
MDINELRDAKKEILSVYDYERSLLNNTEADALLKDELVNIENEIHKINTMIDIYQHEDIEYKVMRLERLYLQNVMNKTEEEFNDLSDAEVADAYVDCFPQKWAFAIPLDEKLNYLEDAIIDNKMINIKDNSFKVI